MTDVVECTPAVSTVQPLFAPRAVAVVGASTTSGKLGAAMMESLTGFPGPVAPVNPRSGPFASIAEAVAEHPEIDLAVLCVPAAAAAQAVLDCGTAGIGAAVVCAGGFAEAGGPGLAHQTQLDEAVRATGIRLLGPNTSGFFVPGQRLFASFVPGVTELRPGRVGVVAASGGVNHAVAFRLSEVGAGVSLGVGIGGGDDITAPDVLDHLITDDATRAVALHLESIPDGPRLLESVAALSAVKPVVAYVVGRSDVGEFAQSHTGSLATSWAAARALLRQAGAVIVDSETELVHAASALSGRRLAPTPSAGVGLVTGQAGPGLIVTDELIHRGVRLPRLDEASVAELSDLLPPLTYLSNPVDTGRPGPEYSRILSTVSADSGIDVLGVYGITEPVVSLPTAVTNAEVEASIPVLIGVDGPPAEISSVRNAATADAPVLIGPTALSDGLRALVADAQGRWLAESGSGGQGARPDTVDLGSGPWHEAAAKDILDRIGVQTPMRWVVSDLTAPIDEDLLAQTRGPLAVKMLDAAVLHKTDFGGVHLGVASAEAANRALTKLAEIGSSAALIEEMAEPGIDLLLGVRRDPVLGLIALLALGGVEAEIYDDAAILGLPATKAQVEALPGQLRAAPLLAGFRGGPSLDLDELASVITGLGQVMVDNPHLQEFEINPLRLTEQGLIALDAVIIPAAQTPPETGTTDDEEEDR